MIERLFSMFANGVFNIDAGGNGIPEAQVNQTQVTSVFNGVIMVAAALAVVFIVFGGIKYSTSQGNPGETQKAKDTIVYALVGLVIAMISFGIVQLFTLKVF